MKIWRNLKVPLTAMTVFSSLLFLLMISCCIQNDCCPCCVVSKLVDNKNADTENGMLKAELEIWNKSTEKVTGVTIGFCLFAEENDVFVYQNYVENICREDFNPGEKKKFELNLDGCIRDQIYPDYKITNLEIKKVEFENGQCWKSTEEKIKEKFLL